MKRSFKIVIVCFVILLGCSACKRDNMENIEIITSNYPNEFIIERLYGEHSKISTIYPDGVDVNDYKFTKKQKKDFADKDLFIYTGLIDKERDLAISLLDKNKNLKIIDSSYVLENDYDSSQLWSDPSFMLMMSQNVRIGLKEFIENSVLKKEIDENFEKLKIDVSELDANIRLAVDNANFKTIVALDNNYSFLEKYGVKVYILNDKTSEKDLAEIDTLIAKGNITKFFSYNDEVTPNAQNMINKYPSNLEILKFNNMVLLTDEQRETKTDYVTLMNQNLDILKEELYHDKMN